MSVSVGPGTSMSVDFDDHDRQTTAAAMIELADQPPTGARPDPGIPSIARDVKFCTVVQQMAV